MTDPDGYEQKGRGELEEDVPEEGVACKAVKKMKLLAGK